MLTSSAKFNIDYNSIEFPAQHLLGYVWKSLHNLLSSRDRPHPGAMGVGADHGNRMMSFLPHNTRSTLTHENCPRTVSSLSVIVTSSVKFNFPAFNARNWSVETVFSPLVLNMCKERLVKMRRAHVKMQQA